MSPFIGFPAAAFSGKQVFSGSSLEKQTISPHIMQMDQNFGGLIFGDGIGDPNAFIQTKLEFPSDRLPGGPSASKYSQESRAGLLNKMGHPWMGEKGGGMIVPEGAESALNWWMIQNGVGAAALSPVPIARFGTQLLGRSGKNIELWDRGDLASHTMEKIGIQALIDLTYEVDSSKLSRPEFEQILNPDYEQNPDLPGFIYDLYWRPAGIPPEYYAAQIFGLRYQFIRTPRQQSQNALNNCTYA